MTSPFISLPHGSPPKNAGIASLTQQGHEVRGLAYRKVSTLGGWVRWVFTLSLPQD